MKVMSPLVPVILPLVVVGNAMADLVAHYQFENDARDSSGNRLSESFVGDAAIGVDVAQENLHVDGRACFDVRSDCSISLSTPALPRSGRAEDWCSP